MTNQTIPFDVRCDDHLCNSFLGRVAIYYFHIHEPDKRDVHETEPKAGSCFYSAEPALRLCDDFDLVTEETDDPEHPIHKIYVKRLYGKPFKNTPHGKTKIKEWEVELAKCLANGDDGYFYKQKIEAAGKYPVILGPRFYIKLKDLPIQIRCVCGRNTLF